MNSKQIRQKFLDFFADKGHKVLPSASLIPHNDPSLLWINAGMAPFKSYFDGSETPPSSRVATSQKCIRTNDIENVGQTARHHTFFEMLGNFSFGDYFKEEAIKWSYEFLIEELEFEVEKLWISIYKDDDRAFEIWHKEIGIPKEKIVRMDKDENFWEIGTGPCGPCSEIHYDRGLDFGCDDGCQLGCDCDRYLEIWNLVFTQYNKTASGEYLDLPNKNIDTGVGLERLAAVLQGAETNFETDLFMPIINYIAEKADVKYGDNRENDLAIKVIADHIRGITFAISDGALPSNEGRGYIVRRMIRRAVRYAKVLELEMPFLYTIVALVVDIMGEHYTKLKQKIDQIERIIKQEELKFEETLEQGMGILNDYLLELENKDEKVLSGKKVFTLYDTYGFPKELTEEIAAEKDFSIDKSGFKKEMKEQKQRARDAREVKQDSHQRLELYKKIREEYGLTEFIGYDNYNSASKVIAITSDSQEIKEAKAGDEVEIILDKTPFYAESGGQVGDKGVLKSDDFEAEVYDTGELAELTYHKVKIIKGQLKTGAKIKAEVALKSRKSAAKNHTATHLLHQALKEVLGEHVNQSGSLVTANKLRFDFSHFEALTKAELKEIELIVNQKIQANIKLEVENMNFSEAKQKGAMALFNENYGEQVRVVQIDDYSKELCGGTHVKQTGEIGVFKLIKESGIASGVRRIEAITGDNALDYIQQQEDRINQAAKLLKSNPDEITEGISDLKSQIKSLEKEITKLKDKLAASSSSDIIAQAEEINDISVILHKVDGIDSDGLRKMGDNLKQKLESGIIILASDLSDKVVFVAMVSDNLVTKGYHAGEIISEVASVAGGGGGGRPSMAQAGGSLPNKISEALDKAREIIASK